MEIGKFNLVEDLNAMEFTVKIERLFDTKDIIKKLYLKINSLRWCECNGKATTAYVNEDSSQIYCDKHANVNSHKEKPIILSGELELIIITLCELEKDLVLLQAQMAYLKWENELYELVLTKDQNDKIKNSFDELKANLKKMTVRIENIWKNSKNAKTTK